MGQRDFVGGEVPKERIAQQSSQDVVVSISPEALKHLLAERSTEEEPEKLGLRVVVEYMVGEPYRYDLSFQEVLRADVRDRVETVEYEGEKLRVLIPEDSVPHLRGSSMDFSPRRGLVLRNPNKPPTVAVEGLVQDDGISREVRRVIDEDLNPSLAAHGGWVEYIGHDGEGCAYVRMGGGCQGCAMSAATMAEGVERSVIESVPELRQVRDITDHKRGENPYYKSS